MESACPEIRGWSARWNEPGLRASALRLSALIPSHLLRSSWLGLRAVSRQRNGRSPGPTRVGGDAYGIRVPGDSRLERWNQPGLRASALRLSALIPSHLLRSSWELVMKW
jgi:hypothetical protein